MNHWQKQWLSDRLHKKDQPTPAPPVTLCFAACQFDEKNVFYIREDFSQKASLDD